MVVYRSGSREGRDGRDGRSVGAGVTPGGDPVLAARLTVPSVPGTFVRRERLVEQLDEGAGRPLTLVDGPAGAGKTLLVADWVTARAPGAVAWLTVEPQDSAPGVFWSYVLHALRHHGIALPEHIRGPARPGEVDHSLLARLAAWLNERDSRVILVLDEFDRVAESAAVADELQFVLRHAGDGLRLVVISRTEPLLPLYRYRAAGELVDIRADDLAFRAEETAALVDRHGLPLSAEAARALTERTEGWAAGLRLCALAAQRADDPESFLDDFEAGHSTVADFLLGEVLRAQPAETQDLLLRTSILERTHPDLTNALTGRDDAEPVLETLQRANAFVEPLGHSWYRLHSLFAEILRVRLRVRHPGLEPELHRRAAEWLSRAGLLDEALRHAADAGDWELAATELVGQLAIGRLLTGLAAERLDALFAGMAPEASGPAPDLVRAARELAHHDVDRGVTYLRRAEENLPDLGADSTDDAAATRLSCAVLRVLAARVVGSADLAETAARDAAEAEQALPADRLERSPELTALMLTDLGSAQLWAGRFDAARGTLSAAVDAAAEGLSTAFPRHEAPGRVAKVPPAGRRLARTLAAPDESPRTSSTRASARHAESTLPHARTTSRGGTPMTPPGPPSGRTTGLSQHALGRLALIDFLHGRPGQAEAHARGAVAEAERSGLPVAYRTGMPQLVLAAVAVDRDDLTAAQDHLDEAAATSAASRDPLMAVELAILRSRMLVARGDPRAALSALDDMTRQPLGSAEPSPWVSDRIAMATAAAHLADGDPKAAVKVFEEQPLHSPESRAAEARARVAAGDGERALRILDALPESRDQGPAVDVWLLLTRAQVLEARGDSPAAEGLVLRALAAARPHQLRRPFLEAGPWLGRLLRRPALAREHTWLTGTLAPHRAQPPPPEPLSAREQDVLERLAQLMSTEEIAADLHLSVNTVKTHLKSIYRKLAATRRGEAVRHARDLGLL
ncbi:LuxR C-terminal-related transcriptional regulator [Streptomyces muensis]|uniref:LuxR C-terminal-related transcriptional regulator n=1 Tax=Streptomyces muensis TaxID=1077944 RepID=A0A9X1PVM2_STRM4|nr:LuxR C-terminal-related transcriptional regulator [Streptomyces muensis]MCF1594277.1 LuxR C-terminal-related transcriptional regulator [Streptomyces muensis]